MAFIESGNAKGQSYTVGVNQFAHLTKEGFNLSTLAQREAAPSALMMLTWASCDGEIASTVDWSTDRSVVNPVKDQGQ